MPAMDIHDSNAKELMDYARNILSTTWNWLTEVMNSIENQLKIGEEFDTQVSDFISFHFISFNIFKEGHPSAMKLI